MIRTASSLLILALLAGSASAQEVRVSLAGKSPQAISAEIEAAAAKVCRSAYAETHIGLDEMSACIRAAVDDAQTQVKAAVMASDGRIDLASAASPPRR
jgi:prolyl-tRNA editing enzyme YbaK/EbsC (Cys-tRNA(Pro) deacylase)